MLSQYRRTQRRLREHNAQRGKVCFGCYLAVDFQDGFAILLLAVVGFDCAFDRVWRTACNYGCLDIYLRCPGQVCIAQRAHEFVLAAGHQRAPDDLAGQQKFDGFGETGFALAIRSPYGHEQRRKFERLLVTPESPEAENFKLCDPARTHNCALVPPRGLR